MPDKPLHPQVKFSPLALSKILLALDDAGHLLPAGVKAEATRRVRDQARVELEDKVESAYIDRQLNDRAKNCPVLDGLMNRLIQAKSSS